MSLPSIPAVSRRVLRMHMPERAEQIGMSVREADRWLNLDGGGHGLLDTTHFDTARFPPPAWAADVIGETVASGELAYTPYRGHPGVLDALAGTLGGFLGVPLSPAENLALTPVRRRRSSRPSRRSSTRATWCSPWTLTTCSTNASWPSSAPGCRRVPLICGDSAGTHLDLDALEQACAQRPKLMLFSNPSNPAVHPYSAGDRRDRRAGAASGTSAL